MTDTPKPLNQLTGHFNVGGSTAKVVNTGVATMRANGAISMTYTTSFPSRLGGTVTGANTGVLSTGASGSISMSVTTSVPPVAIGATALGNTTATAITMESRGASTYATTTASPQATTIGVTGGSFEWSTGTVTDVVVYKTNSSTSEQAERPGYQSVRNALKAMHRIGAAGAWTVEEKVYDASIKVLDALNEYSAPAPNIISNGPSSVVFSWKSNDRNLYLTVSEQSVGLMLSTHDDILLRRRLPAAAIEPTHSVFAALKNTAFLPAK